MPIDTAFDYTAILVSIGIVITCLEVHTSQAHYAALGLLDWEVIRVSYRWTIKGHLAKVFDLLFCRFGFLLLNATRCMAALTLIIVSGTSWRSQILQVIALTLVFALTCLFHFRNTFGLDGSDQMTLIVCTVLMLRAFAPRNAVVSVACMEFGALQAGLAYATAGWSKFVAQEWRSGKALTGVMNTSSYGSKTLANLLLRQSGIALALSWILILFEIAFPLALLAGSYSLIFLAAGLVFHAINAWIMGLNNFFWAFAATYPLVYCAAQQFKVIG